MAKPLSQKSILIRQAVTAHPDKTPKELAGLLNDADERMDDKLKFTPNDVSQQKQAMKKPGATTAPEAAPEKPAEAPAQPARKKPGRKPGRPAAAAPQSASAPAADVFGHIEAIKAAVKQLGPDQVKRIVGLFE